MSRISGIEMLTPEEAVRAFDEEEEAKSIIVKLVDDFGVEFVINTAVEHLGGSMLVGKASDLNLQ